MAPSHNDPGHATEQALHDVHAALQSADYERAVLLSRGAIDRGIVHPLFLNLRAYWHEGQNRYPEALADLQRARVLAPGDATILNALGLCLVRSAQIPQAVEAFDAALAVQPDFVPSRFNRAWTAEMLGDLAAARRDYEEVIRLDPGHIEALAGISFLLSRLGSWTLSRAYADRALALDAGHPNAALALASADIEDGNGAAAEARLTPLLQSPRLSPASHALARSLLADSLDQQRRFGEAFLQYREANGELRAIHAGRFEREDVESAYAYVTWLAKYFEGAQLADWNRRSTELPQNNHPTNHIFIVGFPRSGTTLFEQAIGNHPLAVTTEENEAMADSVRSFMSDPEGLTKLSRSGENGLRPFRDAYWRRLEAAGIDVAGKILIDKLPLNVIKLPLVSRLFPDAKIVFAIRDPRDVVLSCFRRRFAMNPSMFEFLTIEGAARFYDAIMRLADLYREKLPVRLHPLRHEDLLADFDGETQAACAFAGIEWHARMREFAERAKSRAIATPTAVQLVRGLNSRGVEHWRNYAGELAPTLPTLQPWIDKFGYGP